MPSLLVSERAVSDLARIADFLLEDDRASSEKIAGLILEALRILEKHPRIGRYAGDEQRELVISHGRTGFIALYEFDEARDRVIVHALRHQREAGSEV